MVAIVSALAPLLLGYTLAPTCPASRPAVAVRTNAPVCLAPRQQQAAIASVLAGLLATAPLNYALMEPAFAAEPKKLAIKKIDLSGLKKGAAPAPPAPAPAGPPPYVPPPPPAEVTAAMESIKAKKAAKAAPVAVPGPRRRGGGCAKGGDAGASTREGRTEGGREGRWPRRCRPGQGRGGQGACGKGEGDGGDLRATRRLAAASKESAWPSCAREGAGDAEGRR